MTETLLGTLFIFAVLLGLTILAMPPARSEAGADEQLME